jgi:hypothetical protein
MEAEKSKFITQQDVRFIFAIIIFLIPIFFAYSSIETKLALIQQDLNTIRSNDLAHMEIELSDLKSRNAIADDRQTNMEIQITQIQTTLGVTKSSLDTFNADNKK